MEHPQPPLFIEQAGDLASIFESVRIELKYAKAKHPRWPVHIVAQAAIVCEESGELIRDALNFKYESDFTKDPDHPDIDRICAVAKMKKEAIQVIASAIRFIENLK